MKEKKAVYKAGQIGCKVVSEEKPWKKKTGSYSVQIHFVALISWGPLINTVFNINSLIQFSIYWFSNTHCSFLNQYSDV